MKGILLDETGDLLIHNGSLVIGNTDGQSAEMILRAYPGEFKEDPQLGSWIISQLNGKPDPFWRGETIKQLKSNKLDVKDIRISEIIELELN
ncbi:MAG: hypothetical protein LBT04_02030 [Prevotellaceae bacterium]|jgi:hypothetical protein|nr:hypothetical protein [Prevotellaceae bacterium]